MKIFFFYGVFMIDDICTVVFIFIFLGMSGVKMDPASGVPDWSSVHKPVGDLFDHGTLVNCFR